MASRGRPEAFAGNPRLAKAVAGVVKKIGKLKPAQAALASEGVSYQPGPGKPKVTEQVNISLPTLAKVCKAHGVELHRGRPKAA
jgi:hypothetical protein